MAKMTISEQVAAIKKKAGENQIPSKIQIRLIDRKAKERNEEINAEDRKERLSEAIRRTQNIPQSFGEQLEKITPEPIKEKVKKFGTELKDYGKFVGSSLADKVLDVGEAISLKPKKGSSVEKLFDNSELRQNLEKYKQEAAESTPSLVESYKIPYKKQIAEGVSDAAAFSTGGVIPKKFKTAIKSGIESLLTQGESLTSGGTMAEIASTALAGPAGAALFVPSLAKGVKEGGQKAYKGFKEGNYEDVGSGLGEVVGSGAGVLGITKGLAKRIKVNARPMDYAQPKLLEAPKEGFKTNAETPVLPPPKTPVKALPKPTPSIAKTFIPYEKPRAYTTTTQEGFLGDVVEKSPIQNIKTITEEKTVVPQENKIFIDNPDYLKAKKQQGIVADLIFKPEERGEWIEAPQFAVLPDSVKQKVIEQKELGFTSELEKRTQSKYPKSFSATPTDVARPLYPKPVTILRKQKPLAAEPIAKPIVDPFIAETPQSQVFQDTIPPRQQIQGDPAIETPQPVATKQAFKETPVGTVSPEAIEGTGETKPRMVSKRVEASAVEDGLTKGFGDLPDYKTVNMADQSRMASDLVNLNYDLAKQIVFGNEPAPKGVLPESIFLAVEKAAKLDKDIDLLHRLATSSPLVQEGTTMGQRIRAWGEREPNSPLAAINEINKERKKRAETKLGKSFETEKSRTKTEIKNEMNKTKATKESWASFVDSIRC